MRIASEREAGAGASGGRRERAPRALDQAYVELAPEVRAWIKTRSSLRLRTMLEDEDIAQEVWLRVALSFARFDPERGSFRSWIYRITQHTLLDLLRALRATPLRLEEAEAGSSAALECAPLGAGASEESPTPLLAELAAMPPEDRRLLWICAVEGRPSTAAARELAISESAARKRWLRLRRRLARRTDLAARE